MDADRLPLPAAYADIAFHLCLKEAIETKKLVENFDRLYGAALCTGKPEDGDTKAFIRFVHDGIYMRLPDDAIHSLRECGQKAIAAAIAARAQIAPHTRQPLQGGIKSTYPTPAARAA